MKVVLLSGLVLFVSASLFGQKSFLKFQVGYAFPIANATLTTNFSTNNGVNSSSGVYGSFGSGLQLEAGYEYMFSEKISAQLDATYVLGNDAKGNFSINNNGNAFSQNRSINARFVEISPLIKFNLVSDKMMTPYVAIGPMVGFGSVTSNILIPGGGSGDQELQQKYSGPISLGAKSAVGIRFSKGITSFYAQVTLINLSFTPSTSEIIKYTDGGVDKLSTLTVQSKQTVYKESITSNSNASSSQPTEALKIYLPLSSVSLNIGFMIKI